MPICGYIADFACLDAKLVIELDGGQHRERRSYDERRDRRIEARGVVIACHEKSAHPPGNLANAAVYIFEPSVIDFLAALGKDVIDLSTEILPRYLRRMQAFHNADYHRDIGSPESLALAEREYV